MGVIQSVDYFIVNGVSSATIGLYTDTPPIPPMAMQRVTTWYTGEDMDGHSPDNVYENIEVTVTAFSFFPENFNFSAVYAFLADAKTLMFTRFPQRYLKVVQVSEIIPVQRYDGAVVKIEITFLCEPFKYHTSNNEVVIDETRRIENPGTRYSRPIYKLRHSISGETILSVNGELCFITADAPNPLYIDTERMLVYDDEGKNKTRYTRGSYPFLAPGTNLLSCYTYTGGGLQKFYDLSVIGNWRDY